MATLLHAITSASDAATDDITGLRGKPLGRLYVDDLVGWATELDADASFTRADLLDHHRIVSDVFARVDACLPARFPTWTDAAGTLVHAKCEVLHQELERVKGCAELAITAVWTHEEAAVAEDEPLAPGRRYLRERQRAFEGSDRRRERANALLKELTEIARSSLRDVQSQVCPSRTVALSLALLVARATAQDVKARVPRIGSDVRILVNGPWPPYTFAGVAQHSGQGDG